jgi:hypothetical protein
VKQHLPLPWHFLCSPILDRRNSFMRLTAPNLDGLPANRALNANPNTSASQGISEMPRCWPIVYPKPTGQRQHARLIVVWRYSKVHVVQYSTIQYCWNLAGSDCHDIRVMTTIFKSCRNMCIYIIEVFFAEFVDN